MAESWLDFVRSKFQQPPQKSVMDADYQPMNQGNALRAGLARGAMDVSPLALADAPMGGLKTMPLAKIIAQRLGIPMETPTEKLAATLGIQKPEGSPFDPNARQASAGWEFGRSAAQAAPAAAWQMANAVPTKATPQFTINQDGQIVWHGSPHKFDRFDSSKIGTGEGAQAYGHGLYLAESPDVAKSYQSALSADRGFSYGGKTGLTRSEVQDMVNAKVGPGYLDGVLRPSGVADVFIDDMITGTARAPGTYPRQYKPGSQRAKLYDELRGQIMHADPGSLYKVDLPDSAIAKMLDWDKPLSQQPTEVQSILESKSLNKVRPGARLNLDGSAYSPIGEPTGADIYNYLSQAYKNNDKTAGVFNHLGIPGIRYLDGGSRGAGAGTSNFVVFPGNESLLQILERNGVPLK